MNNIILVIVLVPYLGIRHVESTKTQYPFLKEFIKDPSVDYFEDESVLLRTEKEFNTLIKSKRNRYLTSTGTLDKVVAQTDRAIQWEYKYLLESAISKTNGRLIRDTSTHISGIPTITWEYTETEGTTTTPGISPQGLEITIPEGSSTTPGTSPQGLETTIPEGSSTTPGTSPQGLETTIPEGSSTTPGTSPQGLETTIPEGSSTTPGTSPQGLETTIPEGSSTTPGTSTEGLETTIPEGKTMTLANSTSSVPRSISRDLSSIVWHTDVTSSVSPTSGYCDREYSCADCNTARVCAPTPGGQSLWEVAQFSCPDYAPWCDSHSGTCSTVRTPECDLPVVGNFTCMRNGQFPDPNSCSDYYVCDNDVPLEFTCLYLSPYYSPQSHSCSNSSSDCVDYLSLCKDKSGLKVPVPRVNNLFLYCEDGTVEVVDKCIGAYRFDFDRQECVPECPHAGLFPRDDDCAGYYRCSPSHAGDHYVMTNLTCSQGLGFSESAYDCIDRSLVRNCNVTYIS